MLSPNSPTVLAVSQTDDQSEKIDFEKLFAIARRQWRVVGICVAFFAVLAVIYLLTTARYFTASTSVLIDRGNSELINQLSSLGAPIDDETALLSEIQLFQSDTIALAVVDNLKLADDPVFMASDFSLTQFLKSALNFNSWFASADLVTAADDRRQDAASMLNANMDVERVGKSYALSISYTSRSPDQAAAIANALADAYLVDKLNSKFEATSRASGWLQERIDELKQKALESDLAVQKFRADHGLVATDGNLLTDQQLSELSSNLIKAQADTARAQAKFDRIRKIIDAGQMDAIVTDVLDNSPSNDIRKKYLEDSKLAAEISARLGPDHEQVLRLKAEMDEYKRQMFDELNRIAESYRSDLDVAQTRQKSLEDSVAKATQVSAAAGETQVELRELERKADSYRNLYQSFLTRFQEAVQQQSFPITDARVITRAQTPDKPSAPKKPLVLAVAIFLGLAAGSAIGAFREFRDRFFRTGDQVREILGLEYLGHIPKVAAEEFKISSEQSAQQVRKISGLHEYVVEHPLSAFAETLRNAKVAADIENPMRQTKIIGVVSCLPSEGKSTLAINFAQLLSNQGARTLLIDGDLRNPGATRALGQHAADGLLEALLQDRPLDQLILTDPVTNLSFLPAVVKYRVPHSSDVLASAAMANLLSEATKRYDYIVLDLPPLGPVVDARAISHLLDTVLLVVEWGNTSRRIVQSIMTEQPEIRKRCAGVILNKVDLDKIKLYRSHGSSEYYYSRYSNYYQEN
ncbi:succinoglycan biosynthesis transport protein ExoP [Rhizobium sp. BK529]|uniref:polysaccharide biosynthesis tyrosine autokinase n=1 Tax=unclassified Rhizobium TaxID=2613769 RepID=UPI001047343E|nr:MULTISPECIES: polysaccharide biosynthesis tyrosine autokinase [unclassified Rhizobium]MBB3595720.1 succinoglycan biosynthesis transport protein ExoP [Rhizobium sp. BK529]TCR98273.1 succinoglycan biosynthesis transport protein ExoP [Rhizobium sp. BK418]